MNDQYIQLWADCHNDQAIRNINGWLHNLFANEYEQILKIWENEKGENDTKTTDT